MDKVRSLDWIGYFLLVAGLVPLLMGFAFSSDSKYGWHDAHSYAPVAVGLVGLLATCLYEWKGTKTGFLDHRLFQNGRNFPLCLFLISVEGALFYLMNNLYPSETNGLWAPAGSIQASAQLLPFFLVILVVAPIMTYCEPISSVFAHLGPVERWLTSFSPLTRRHPPQGYQVASVRWLPLLRYVRGRIRLLGPERQDGHRL